MMEPLVMSVLLLAQAGTVAAIEEAKGAESTEVAYEELAAGNAAAAIRNLETLLRDNPDDPALLINLGSAYAEQGDQERAADYYRRAIDSDTRYRLELADGRWADSRLAARQALQVLETEHLALN